MYFRFFHQAMIWSTDKVFETLSQFVTCWNQSSCISFAEKQINVIVTRNHENTLIYREANAMRWFNVYKGRIARFIRFLTHIIQ